MRAIAVTAVVLFHAGFSPFAGGYVGVDVFFVISGYLITAIIFTEKLNGTFSLKAFLARRARRILPALYFVMLCSMPFALWLMLPSELTDFSESLLAVSLFASNFYFWHETGYFGGSGDDMPLLHTWSLAVEEQFYLVFPLVFIAIWKVERRWLPWLLAVLAAASLLLADLGARIEPTANFYLAPTRAWEFLAGALCAIYLHGRTAPRSNLLSLTGLGSIGLAVFTFDGQTPFPSLLGLAPVLGTALIILYGSGGTLIAGLLAAAPLRTIGLMSYSAYLWHNPLFAFARLGLEGEPATAEALLLVAAAFGLGYLTWRWIELPFRQAHYMQSRRAMAGGAVALIVAAGISGVFTQGMLMQYPAPDRYLAGLDNETESAFLDRRFKSLLLKEFTNQGKPRILVIGDSYGQDFVNVLYEGGMSSGLDVSTYSIKPRCGNLLLGTDFFAAFGVDQEYRCSMVKRYDDPRLRRRIAEADVVVLASSWTEWEARLLPRSLANIDAITQAKILVLGRKNFGQVDARALLEMPEKARPMARVTTALQHIAVNTLMRQTLPPDAFINFQELVCESEQSCPVYTDELELISYDGGHLTKSGARFVARKIFADSRLRNLLTQSPKAGLAATSRQGPES